jgi:pilus assembly protein CpaE
MNQQETTRAWRLQGREAEVHLYLSAVDGDPGSLLGARVHGLPLTLSIVPVSDWIDASDLGRAAVAVVQVDADSPASLKRFERLVATAGDTPVIAAAFEPPLALVRSLLRTGAHDVLPLPLSLGDLETSIAPLAEQVQQKEVQALAGSSRQRGDGHRHPTRLPLRRPRSRCRAQGLPARSRRAVRRRCLPAGPQPQVRPYRCDRCWG